MSYFESFILGLVQGLTEFIPVSSSGHLIVIHEWFGSRSTDLAFDAILQLATALAVLLYFRKDIGTVIKNGISILRGISLESRERNLFWALVCGTIPAAVLGILLESAMETSFRSMALVAAALIFGSILMAFADRSEKRAQSLTVHSGIFIGLFQSLALIPGMSRSGATISGGLLAGLSREEATRFSFLLSFPIIAGSGLKKVFDLPADDLFSLTLLIASLTAFFSGLFAIHYLLKYVRTHTLTVFICYRLVLAGIILTFLF